MRKKERKIVCLLVSMIIISLLFANSSFSQQLAVKRQTDGTIKIESTSTKIKTRISNMVFCKTIDELIKEEKNTVNKLLSDDMYEEVKESVEIIQELHALKLKQCR